MTATDDERLAVVASAIGNNMVLRKSPTEIAEKVLAALDALSCDICGETGGKHTIAPEVQP